jgi:hypothetical protein
MSRRHCIGILVISFATLLFAFSTVLVVAGACYAMCFLAFRAGAWQVG